MNPDGASPYRYRAALGEQCRLRYPEAAVKELMDRVGLRSDHTVVDQGAGTGLLSRWLAGRVQRLLLIDTDADMLTQAALVLQPQAGICLMQAKVSQLPVKNGSVDVITVAQSLHWFESEPTRREMRRVAAAKCRLAAIHNAPQASPLTHEAMMLCAEYNPTMRLHPTRGNGPRCADGYGMCISGTHPAAATKWM